jgi:hypothetical protein
MISRGRYPDLTIDLARAEAEGLRLTQRVASAPRLQPGSPGHSTQDAARRPRGPAPGAPISDKGRKAPTDRAEANV